MSSLLYQQPIAILAALVAVVFVGVYWLGCVALRPFFRVLVRSYGGDNEIVGSVLAAFGVLYGLLMSLIAVAAYQNVNDVESQAVSEASALLALYRAVGEYPMPLREDLEGQLVDYCTTIIVDEWPLLRQGMHPRGSHLQLELIFQDLMALEHSSRRDELIQERAIRHFEAMADQGRRRRYASVSAIPLPMWYVVIVGTIINYGLMWSFDMRFVTQLFLGGMLAFFLGALILLIAVLERPYRSLQFGVPPDAFVLAREIMVQDGNAPPAELIRGGR